MLLPRSGPPSTVIRPDGRIGCERCSLSESVRPRAPTACGVAVGVAGFTLNAGLGDAAGEDEGVPNGDDVCDAARALADSATTARSRQAPARPSPRTGRRCPG